MLSYARLVAALASLPPRRRPPAAGDMLLFAERLGPAAAVVCVSNDQGFGPSLERCSRMGAFTVAGGPAARLSLRCSRC